MLIIHFSFDPILLCPVYTQSGLRLKDLLDNPKK
jgi:hypothetical protein